MPAKLEGVYSTTTEACDPQVREQGVDVLQNLYLQAVKGAECLSARNPKLQQRAAVLPCKGTLLYIKDDLSSLAGLSTGRTHAGHGMWSEIQNKDMFTVLFSAGVLLRHKSARSLQWVMAHEVAHGLARHADETASQAKLIAATTFGRLMLSGMGWMSTIAATFLSHKG